ncbi:MAG: sialidase family protein [Armatimonadota bacterium]|nr:sialidase family protein [Armatimonadota bacterium]
MSTNTVYHQRISRGGAAGSYQAFPDACRLRNGDIVCVFYAGYGHISLPNREYPRGGRLCLVRSRDEGRTWSQPQELYDGPDDDRDPHIAQLSNSTLVCSFFTYRQTSNGEEFDTKVLFSHDDGYTWSKRPVTVAKGFATSTPVREVSPGRCLLGVYTVQNGQEFAAMAFSNDAGLHWHKPLPISAGCSTLPDGSETDIIRLKDGNLLAVIRSDKVNMHFCLSRDEGKTWTPPQDIGFPGHAPHLTRLSTGAILLTHRLPHTALHISRDEGKSWQGPFVLDEVIGAYPSTVELKDGSVLVVYYEEGEGSAIRALRIQVRKDGIEKLKW